MLNFIWGYLPSISEPYWKETHQPVISSYEIYMNGRISPTIGGKLLYIKSEGFTLSRGTQNLIYKQKELNPAAVLPSASLGWGQGLWKAEGKAKTTIGCDIKSGCLDPINVCFKI